MKKDYRSMRDEELVSASRAGDQGATDHLMEKYKGLVRKRAGSMYILGAGREDLLQEGMIGLFKALRDFETDKNTEFSSFASLCISRQMYTAVEASRRKKHAPLNTYVSIYSGESEEEDIIDNPDFAGYSDALLSMSGQNPEDMLIDRENVSRIWELIEENLSSLERKVLDLLITGMEYTEIARVLGRSPKSADNAIQRVKAKIRKALAEGM